MWLITLIDLWILKNPCIPGIKPKEEDITIVNIYAPNIGAPQYIRQILTDIKGEIDSNTVIVGDFTPHSHQWTDHPNRKLIKKHKS